MFAESVKEEPILLQYGLAEKSYFNMSNEERDEVSALVFERVKEAAFTRGLPIIYGENGYVIAEYADGHRFIREDGKDIKPYYGS